jgi:hypothetical protein
MKAILEFDLPEEHEEFQHAVNGTNFAILFSDLQNEIRSKLKYDGGHFEHADAATVEMVRDWICSEMSDRALPNL